PEPALPKPAERFDGVGALDERECAAVFEEAAKPDAPGAAHLDERELRHRVVGHGPLDDRDLARAVEDDGDHLPRLDELGEAPGLVARPDAARPVGVLLDRVLELPRLLEAIEDVGGLAIGSWPAADQDARRAQPLQTLDVAPPVGLASGRGRRSSPSSPSTWRSRRASASRTPRRSRRSRTRSSTTSLGPSAPTRSASSRAT